MGFEISYKPFEMYSKYLRCALVRSNYKVVNFGFNGDNDCLNKFFDNMMFHREHILDLKDTVVKDMFRLPNGTYDIPYLDIFSELDDELID